MHSLWFTQPVAFAAAGNAFAGGVQWSSFFHEMGHNITLNSPANYFYGGKSDGHANAILSEALAQIFQHATVYEVIKWSNPPTHGELKAWLLLAAQFLFFACLGEAFSGMFRGQ